MKGGLVIDDSVLSYIISNSTCITKSTLHLPNTIKIENKDFII